MSFANFPKPQENNVTPVVTKGNGALKRPVNRTLFLSQPTEKRFQIQPHSQYMAGTCELLFSNSEKDQEEEENFDPSEVFDEKDLNDCTQMENIEVATNKDTELTFIRMTLTELKQNYVSKRDFQQFVTKFEKFQDLVSKHLIQDDDAENEGSQSLLSNETRVRERVTKAKDELFCVVEDGGTVQKLSLPKSIVMKVEAARSKRGIVKEILKFVHPERGYFDRRTLTGHGGNNRKDSLSPMELEPLPALTIKYCLAAVNRVKPLDEARFQESVLAEERAKYDNQTREEIGRAIIDIRRSERHEKKTGHSS